MLEKFNILIVDDDLSSIQLGINILKLRSDYNIIFATNASKAFQRIDEHQFDLILLDILMEPIDGFEVCNQLKNNPKTKDIPIIFLSSKDDKESIARGFKIGAVDYITKPFFAEELSARVDTHIKLKSYKDKLLYELNLKENYIKHQDKIVQQQSQQAQIGEIISMLAHQWRQPLGAISSAIISMETKKELGKYNLDLKEDRDELFRFCDKKYDHIKEYVKSLSDTIDNFRNFFKPDNNLVSLSLDTPVKKAIQLIGISMENGNIELFTNYNTSKKLPIYENEFMQVILNILKNSKDNFIQKDIKNPKITITTQEEETFDILTICDNGGGIPEDIIDKIFDPYFSTKNEKNGTGLGLYMSKIMIEEHLNGTIKVSNTQDGACFTISINTNKL
jgi:signal transduction histidine kinase